MRNLQTITVGELIELLQGEDEDKQVIFATDYGDICHTEQALPLKGRIEEVSVAESGYSNSGFAIIGDDDEYDDDDEPDTFLVIR